MDKTTRELYEYLCNKLKTMTFDEARKVPELFQILQLLAKEPESGRDLEPLGAPGSPLREYIERLLKDWGERASFSAEAPPAEYRASKPRSMPKAGDMVDFKDDFRRARGVELLKFLDAGSEGEVFEARLRTKEKHDPVAIKLFTHRKAFTDSSIAAQSDVIDIQAMLGLRHPNIVKALGAGNTSNDVPFLTMELIPGKSLKYWFAQPNNHLTEHDAASIVELLSDGVQAIHDKGLVHCDLKLGNTLGCPEGNAPLIIDRIKIGDFGSARPRGTVRWGGTLPYMAPERLHNWADERSDVFSLGMILLFLINKGFGLFVDAERAKSKILNELTLLSPQSTPDVGDELRSGYEQFLIRLQDRVGTQGRAAKDGVDKVLVQDPVLRAIIGKCLDSDAEKRYPTAAELRNDLARWRKDQCTVDSGYQYSTTETCRLFFRRCGRNDRPEFAGDQAILWSFGFLALGPLALIMFGVATIAGFRGYDIAIAADIAGGTFSLTATMILTVFWLTLGGGHFVRPVSLSLLAWALAANVLLRLGVLPIDNVNQIASVMATMGAMAAANIWVFAEAQLRIHELRARGEYARPEDGLAKRAFTPLLGFLPFILAIVIVCVWPHYPEYTRLLGPAAVGTMYFLFLLGTAYFQFMIGKRLRLQSEA